MPDLQVDPDGPPERERTVWRVQTWGDLRVGDVVNVKHRPVFITRIYEHPLPVDVQALVDEMNETRRGTLDLWGKPYVDRTIADLKDDWGWKGIIADPAQIGVSFKADPDDPKERSRSWRVPAHARLPSHGRFLVATGPDPHFQVCWRCGDVWPCTHRKMEYQVNEILEAEKIKCGHCGRPVRAGNGQYTVKVAVVDAGGPREILYHGRKGPCLDAALRADPTVAEQRARYDW